MTPFPDKETLIIGASPPANPPTAPPTPPARAPLQSLLKPQQSPRAIIQGLPVKSEIGNDSTSEKILFWDLLRHNKVKEIYFTGMLIHGQSDFFVQYIDPETHAIRSCYPDFLFKKTMTPTS